MRHYELQHTLPHANANVFNIKILSSLHEQVAAKQLACAKGESPSLSPALTSAYAQLLLTNLSLDICRCGSTPSSFYLTKPIKPHHAHRQTPSPIGPRTRKRHRRVTTALAPGCENCAQQACSGVPPQTIGREKGRTACFKHLPC